MSETLMKCRFAMEDKHLKWITNAGLSKAKAELMDMYYAQVVYDDPALFQHEDEVDELVPGFQNMNLNYKK